jgi:predicted Co/Zn/Cd cation transporter (cation efflux family)
MSHAMMLALINNHSEVFNISRDIEYAFNSLEGIFTEMMAYLSTILIPFCFSVFREFTHFVSAKYTATFGDNHVLAYVCLVVVSLTLSSIINFYKNIFDRMNELEDHVNYAKKKIQMQDGEIEYLLNDKENNEKKFIVIQKRLQKVNKELKQYA